MFRSTCCIIILPLPVVREFCKYYFSNAAFVMQINPHNCLRLNESPKTLFIVVPYEFWEILAYKNWQKYRIQRHNSQYDDQCSFSKAALLFKSSFTIFSDWMKASKLCLLSCKLSFKKFLQIRIGTILKSKDTVFKTGYVHNYMMISAVFFKARLCYSNWASQFSRIEWKPQKTLFAVLCFRLSFEQFQQIRIGDKYKIQYDSQYDDQCRFSEAVFDANQA